MSNFVMGVTDDLVVECRLGMLHDNINISRLVVHAKQVEESRLKRKNRYFKSVRPYEGGNSKGSWTFKTNLSSTRNSPTKLLLNFLRLTRIGCLTLGPKGE